MKTVCLGDIIRCIRGVATRVSKEWDNSMGDRVACFRAMDIITGLDRPSYVPRNRILNEDQYVQPRDILMVMRGPESGRCIYVDYIEFEATIDLNVSILRVQSHDINPHYLLYWLKSPSAQFHIKHRISGGESMFAIKSNLLLKTELSIHSKIEQDEIAKNFEKIDNFCKKQQEIWNIARKLSKSYALRVFST